MEHEDVRYMLLDTKIVDDGKYLYFTLLIVFKRYWKKKNSVKCQLIWKLNDLWSIVQQKVFAMYYYIQARPIFSLTLKQGYTRDRVFIAWITPIHNFHLCQCTGFMIHEKLYFSLQILSNQISFRGHKQSYLRKKLFFPDELIRHLHSFRLLNTALLVHQVVLLGLYC